ncbi:MAG: hypothetical protein DRP35_00610 [Candidatus Zixiibacteriota bacterium]|nr:MAG: hypothetical protein DRP35_00610 [candidate division Zixibacteria bacterium]
MLKVHKQNCTNLKKAEPDRLVQLEWHDILEVPESKPDDDFNRLEIIDFKILEHHQNLGIDYSLKVAKDVNIPKQDAFDRHEKLKNMELIERVDALMVQYRKGVVKNKWIKHRNHTYYQITSKGKKYLDYFLEMKK